jgi:hypothetical protein
MRRRLSTWLTLALAAGVTVLAVATSPASAERGSQAYPRGSAPAAIDITRLTVHNGGTRFMMRVDVRDLGERGTFHFHYWSGRRPSPSKRSLLIVVRQVEGDAAARLLACNREECFPEPCRGLRSTWAVQADVVRVSAPQHCFPRANPGADPPRQGRFFAWSETGRHVDPNPPSALRLARG